MNRREGGKQAERGGRAFEDALKHAHDAYETLGSARIRQLPVPTVYVGNGLRRLSARQGYDFEGFFGPNAGTIPDPTCWHGMGLVMEAKRCERRMASLPVLAADKTGFGLKAHQLQSLAEAMDFGAVAAVVWRNGEERRVLGPGGVRRWAKAIGLEGGRIPAGDFSSYDEFIYPDLGPIEDWLFPVRVWLEKHGRPSAAPRSTFAMIPYTIDRANRTVTIDPGKEERKVSTKVVDQVMIDDIARESRTTDEFQEKLRALASANE